MNSTLCISSHKLSFNKIPITMQKRFYSSNARKDNLKDIIKPTPIFVLKNLDNINICKELLKKKGGIYSFINTINGKQYIGSAKDFYIRLNEHLNNKKSNSNLQKAFVKYGLQNFNWVIYEYFTYESKILDHDALTELETNYIQAFDYSTLYNMKRIATSMLGYKHTDEAIQKMIERFQDKSNHPMFGKTHSEEVLKLISKPGSLNPMFGKTHSDKTKELMARKKNKYINGVGIYDLNGNLIKKFNNNVELGNYLSISKVTVGKYLNNNLIYNNLYIFKPIQ
ncbi:putative intron-encoded endonuclease 1 (mitochondrion) [Beauveria bassiana D1-5]|uniref:Putative intron-encoded endonuclease 1 n=2 Tax=Beauveria bassiana TaxID=176275 RepID=A0A0A2V7D3_BEABA|nr:putative intron-encoded endonuclease 1 [Beauveria bassiana D1-5]